jgi:sec-independent protein translocase protein TatA
MGMPGPMEIVLIVAVIVLLFGAKKIPELAKGLGQGIKEFKKASQDIKQELGDNREQKTTPSEKE